MLAKPPSGRKVTLSSSKGERDEVGGFLAAGDVAGHFAREGFVVFDEVASVVLCDALCAELTERFQLQQNSAQIRIGGLRNLLQSSPLVAEVAAADSLKQILRAALGTDAFPVRSIFFDKTADANWSVAWHQDLHIAVAARVETPGFGPWTVKAGVPHVQPPLEVLDGMATLRLHLDDCDETNGALKVIPGSHALGILAGSEFEAWKRRAAVTCSVPKGGAMLMRPLLLHSSSPALQPTHRRVLHIEYATGELPDGLQWFERR